MTNSKQVEFKDRLREELGLSDLDRQKREAADLLGVDPSEISVERDILATRLAGEGMIVAPHIGRTRFMLNLTMADVGLDPENEDDKKFFKNYVSLGHRFLIPAEYRNPLNRIEQQIRQAVVKAGLETKNGIFVPYDNLPDLEAEIDDLIAKYYSWRDKIIGNYEAIKLQTRWDYSEYAVSVYQHQQHDRYAYPPPEFTEDFVTRAMKKFPDKDEVYKSFYVDIEKSLVPTTAHIAQYHSYLELAQQREAQIRRELDLIDRKLTEGERLQNEKERMVLEVERERQQTLLQKERVKQDAIRESLQEAVQRHRPAMDELFADLTGAAYGMVYDAVDKVRQGISTTGKISIRGLRAALDRAENINLVRDEKVDELVDELRNLLDIPAARRSDSEVKRLLDDLAAETRQITSAVGFTPRSLRGQQAEAREIELPAEPKLGGRQTRGVNVEIEDIEDSDSLVFGGRVSRAG